jgi:cytochrome c biogenesis protein CcmG, thiol:disulfide interchange protein DsbE
VQRLAVPFAAVLVATALIALLVYGVAAGGDGSSLRESVLRGERPPAPSQSLPLLDGEGRRALADLRGQIVVLNFWASWCKPCAEEAGALNRAHERLGDRGTVLGVTFRDASGDSRTFARRHGLRYPSVRDVDGRLARDYDVNALPETFVIDPEGRVAAIGRGQVDDDFLRRALERVGA